MAIRTNYQTVLEIDTATPISEGKMRADGGDLRIFGDAAHTEALDFYIDPTTLNTTATRVHIKQDLPTGRYHPGIALYFPMEDSGDDIIAGISPIVTTGPPTFDPGQVGNAVTFEINEGFSFSSTVTEFKINNRPGGFTVGAWINLSSLANGDSDSDYIVASNNTRGWLFRSNHVGGEIDFEFRREMGTADARTLSSTYAIGQWTHVVGVWDEVALAWDIYVNGVLDNSSVSVGSGTIADDSAQGVEIGRGGVSTREVIGQMDEIVIYHRGLTAEEIRSDYLRGRAGKRLQEPTPTAAWTFNSSDNAGSEVVDLISGLNGTINGTLTIGQQGRVGQSFNFDGSTAYVEVADSSLLEPHTGSSGTSTWFGTAIVTDTAGSAIIISKQENSTPDTREFIHGVLNTNFFLAAMHEDASNIISNISDVSVPLNTRFHWAVTWDFAATRADQLKIYLDGVLVPSSFSDAGSIVGGITSKAEPLRIGTNFQGNAPFNQFEGDIDEVGWSSSVLTDTQIEELARRSKEGLRPDLTDSNLDLLAYWSLDNKDIGVNPQDIFGSVHLSKTGSVLVGQSDGPVGQNIEFPDLTSGRMETTVPASLAIDTDPYLSISMWIRNDVAGVAGGRTILTTQKSGGGQGVRIGLRETFGGKNLASQVWNGSDFVFLTNQIEIVLGQWHHFAMVFSRDGSGATLRGYLDGILAGSTGPNPAFTTADPVSHVGQNFSVGPNAIIGQAWQGAMSNLQWFKNIALTAEQVQDLYQKGRAGSNGLSDARRIYVTYGDTNKTSASSAANTFIREITGLVHAYKFDEVAGGTVTDASGSDNGTITSNVLVENGTTGLARNTNREGVIDFTTQVIPTGAATILTRFRTTTNDQIFWSNYDGYAGNAGLALEITSGGVLQARHSIGAGSDNALATGTVLVDDGELHTVIVTKDDVNVNIYLDGYAVEATDAMVSVDVAADTNYRIGGYRELPFVAPSGLILQLEADSINTSTELDADGRVTDWTDLSSANNDALQLTAADRPLYIAKGLGGLPAVEFWNTWHMNFGSTINLTSSDFTVFYVLQFKEDVDNATTPNRRLTSNTANTNTLTFGSFTGSFANEVITAAAGGSRREAIESITIPGSTPTLGAIGLNGTTMDFRLGGIDQGIPSEAGSGLDSGTGNSIDIDLIGNNTAQTSAGKYALGALLIFNNRLSIVDTNYVERYLALKYGTPNSNVTGLVRAKTSYDEIQIFNRVLTLNEIGDLAANYGEPVGSRVQVRKRNDPEPVLNSSS